MQNPITIALKRISMDSPLWIIFLLMQSTLQEFRIISRCIFFHDYLPLKIKIYQHLPSNAEFIS